MSISDLLFDAPYWLLIVLGLIGVIVLLMGLRSGNKAMRCTGAAVLGIGILLLLLGMFVETGKKQVERRTRELVNAVVAEKASEIRALLDAKANAYGMNRDEIVHAGTTSATDSFVQEVKISSLNVTQDDSGITSKLNCIANFKPSAQTPYPALPTSWELHWAKSPGNGWLVYDIKCTGIAGQDPSVIIGFLQNHRN